jgi:putative endonuclease
MGAHVYMLRCADGSFYVGSATGDDLWKRIAEHETGLIAATPTLVVRFD